MTAANRPPRLSGWILAGLGLVAVGTLAACGGSTGSGGGQPTSAPTSAAPTSPPLAGGPGAGRVPGTFGTIAAVRGTTMQVQSQQIGQVAVRWTHATTFTRTVTGSAPAITIGTCVVAVGASGTSPGATAFTATTLLISRPQHGSCTGGTDVSGVPAGGSFPGGGPPSGFPSGGFPSGALPSGFPSGALPSGFPSGGLPRRGTGGQIGAIASGKVIARSGSKLTITGRQFGSSTTAKKTVAVNSKTKITMQAVTTSKSLVVGKCVSAQGAADSSGTVTATRVQISNPTKGNCTAELFGFGGRSGG